MSTMRWAWRQLTSMRVALWLLLLLALAAIPGSVFPQRGVDSGAVQAYQQQHSTLSPWLDRFGFFDVFTSAWFSAIYLLLFVSLTGCVVPRAAHVWRAWRTPPAAPPRSWPGANSGVRTGLKAELKLHQQRTVSAADAEQLLAWAEHRLHRHGYRTRRYGEVVSASRGWGAQAANLVFHYSLLVVLLLLAFGSFRSYHGQAVVVENETFANVVPAYNSYSPGRFVGSDDLQPFAATLMSLKVQFSAQPGRAATPDTFDAQLRVVDHPGAAPREVVVRPNEPLDVQGHRMFLVGNGYAPVVTVRNPDGSVAFAGPVQSLPQDGFYLSNLVIKAPDAKPRQLAFSGMFVPTYDIDPTEGIRSLSPQVVNPRLVLTGYTSQPDVDGLGVNNGRPQSIFTLTTTNMTQLKGDGDQPWRAVLAEGATVPLPEGAGSVTFESIRRYAAFDIRYDPTKDWVLAAAAIGLLSVSMSLFVPHRRWWVRVRPVDSRGPEGERFSVQIQGRARARDSAAEVFAEKFIHAIGAQSSGCSGDAGGTKKVHEFEPDRNDRKGGDD